MWASAEESTSSERVGKTGKKAVELALPSGTAGSKRAGGVHLRGRERVRERKRQGDKESREDPGHCGLDKTPRPKPGLSTNTMRG